MTVTVIGAWDDAWMDAERTERRIWRQTIDPYMVDRWIMAPDHATSTMSPEQFDSVSLALEAVPGKKTFLVVPSTHEGEDLVNYQHPVDAIYVFGSTADNLMRYVRPEDDIVSIYTPRNGEQFGSTVMGQVLYSRMVQERAV